ncbi:lactate utilization protein [Desulfotalea psychrophila]|uniref:LUD domain-containing protein n=1 Tax=Desulfotalea psychrophila (strain LSv54 / DSM 12343) TaxID=177439 RepID=Q6AQM0_DESPS|nr:lactate utilization protein [Desulfotalea psychrophila]CAG35353.1 conserved hypothetical protein [Desulfotalea psychrophila LSv54]
MENSVDKYWTIRLRAVQENLARNNFDAYVAASVADAKHLVMNEIMPPLAVKTVGFGGSMTLKETGIYDALCESTELRVFRSDLSAQSAEDKIEVRRKSLLVDIFFTGTNALVADGTLVNLDMIGNRVAALSFGPKYVVVVVGRNKIVEDLESAMERIKEYVAPINAMRLSMKTPCATTAECADCQSSQRICNTWAINEKSFPKKRIIVVLVNEDLGF